ncbi:nuclear transport factor 2 family protein [Aurantiacibacter poecillastricola]|uniref:nuclear transport factor 2 family protein n=1 Tax=Aurantiacibacter poecillastricola TaxID=3064385 RepID=UPI0035A2F202
MKAFIKAMNARDFAGVEALLADNFRLIDNADKELTGREPCLALFRRVAELAPDYQLEVDRMVVHGDDILIAGKSRTTSPEMGSATQWRARATPTRMLEWQSYSNALTPSMITLVQRTED